MKRALFAAALLAAAGCQEGSDLGSNGTGTGTDGTDVGNPVTVDLEFASYGRETAGAVVERAAVTVERIRLRPAANCDGGAEIELEGPFTLDLTRPTPLADLTGLELAGQAWCRFEMTWHPDETSDLAILVAGSAAGGDPFEIRSRRNDELRVDALDDAGFTIDAAALFVAFDMAAWLDGIDLASADRDAGGAIVVSDDSNRDLLDRFEANVESAVALFADGDGDGALDDDEHDDTDALAAGTR